MRDDQQRLLDILDSIKQIEKYAVRGKEAFEQDELIQNWIIRQFEMIGEACRAISNELRAQYPTVPWKDWIGMRNILVHHYFEIDLGAVWSGVEHDLPQLKLQISTLLSALPLEE